MTVRHAIVALGLLGALAGAPATAVAAQSNAATTEAYLQANYKFVRYFASHIPAAEKEISGVLVGARRECPHAAAESPQNVDSEQLSNEVIGTMVSTVIQRNLAAVKSFNRTVASLRWSNGALNRTIRHYVADGKVLSALAVPNLCADVKEWVASKFETLPASTVHFDALFIPSWVAPGDLPRALVSYETSTDRALAQKCAALESQITDFEAREVETWGSIMDEIGINP